MGDLIEFGDFTDAADDAELSEVNHVSLHVVCVSMGRNKADGSGRAQSPKDEVVRHAGEAEYTVRPEQLCCLVIVAEQVLSHAPSMRNTSGDMATVNRYVIKFPSIRPRFYQRNLGSHLPRL